MAQEQVDGSHTFRYCCSQVVPRPKLDRLAPFPMANTPVAREELWRPRFQRSEIKGPKFPLETMWLPNVSYRAEARRTYIGLTILLISPSLFPTPGGQVVDRCALTRMAWSPDGRRLCVGDYKVTELTECSASMHMLQRSSRSMHCVV